MGSTDMGDISQIVPGVHAYFRIARPGSPTTPSSSPRRPHPRAGDRAVLDGAAVLAMTAADLLAEPSACCSRPRRNSTGQVAEGKAGRLGRLARARQAVRARLGRSVPPPH